MIRAKPDIKVSTQIDQQFNIGGILHNVYIRPIIGLNIFTKLVEINGKINSNSNTEKCMMNQCPFKGYDKPMSCANVPKPMAWANAPKPTKYDTIQLEPNVNDIEKVANNLKYLSNTFKVQCLNDHENQK
jgi:hypothetical protein